MLLGNTDIPAGWTYDRTHHDFQLEITDADLDGKLEVASIEAVDQTVTPTDTGNTNYYYYVLKETGTTGTGITADGNVYQIMVQVDSTTNSNGAAPSTTPDTGDSTNVGLLIALALSSMACLVVLILSRKHTES